MKIQPLFDEVDFLAALLESKPSMRRGRTRAADLIKAFGSLSAVLGAPKHTLSMQSGLEPDLADRLARAHSIILSSVFTRLENKPYLGQSREVIRYALWITAGISVERVIVIFLDPSGNVAGKRVISEGNPESAPLLPKTIISTIVESGYSRYILVHNHPSGNLSPSPSDLVMTSLLYHAGSQLDIILVDHLIVGNGEAYSFHASGELYKHY